MSNSSIASGIHCPEILLQPISPVMLPQKKTIRKYRNHHVPGLTGACSTAACPGIFCISSWRQWGCDDTGLGHWCCSEHILLFVSPNIWRFPYCTWPPGRWHRVLLWWGWQEKEKKQENEKFLFCINEKFGNVDFP